MKKIFIEALLLIMFFPFNISCSSVQSKNKNEVRAVREYRDNKTGDYYTFFETGDYHVKRFDESGRPIYEKIAFSNMECWYHYDNNGELKEVLVSEGEKQWYSYLVEYDEQGRVIHKIAFDGPESRFLIHENKCYEAWFTYDHDGMHEKIVPYCTNSAVD